MSRLLTSSEIAGFLSRHPIVAAQVAATKAALIVLGYNQINTPPAWYEFDVDVGLIPSWGLAVADSEFGTVVIFPAANKQIYFNAFVEADPEVINQPPFESPPGSSLPDLEELLTLGLAVVGGLIVLQVIR